MDVWSAACGWDRSKCLLWVSLHPVNVTDVKDIWLPCIAALKQNRCEFTGHQWQIDCQKLPLSFTIIILRNCCSRFMPRDRYMCWPVCVCVYEREKMSKKDDKKKDGMEVYVEREVARETEQSFSKSWTLCLCVGLCVCAEFNDPVHGWVCQNSAKLPNSSHRSRFVSLQLQVTKWHCAFMAALHGASHKSWND